MNLSTKTCKRWCSSSSSGPSGTLSRSSPKHVSSACTSSFYVASITGVMRTSYRSVFTSRSTTDLDLQSGTYITSGLADSLRMTSTMAIRSSSATVCGTFVNCGSGTLALVRHQGKFLHPSCCHRLALSLVSVPCSSVVEVELVLAMARGSNRVFFLQGSSGSPSALISCRSADPSSTMLTCGVASCCRPRKLWQGTLGCP